jgi:DNA-binding transcriptional regulator/RsmH inhibitor MraZ
MKHPARHVSRQLRRVRRGQQAFSRQVLHTARRIREDPAFRKLMTELLKHLAELVARAVTIVGRKPMSAHWTLSTRTRASDSDPSEAHRRTLIRHHLR